MRCCPLETVKKPFDLCSGSNAHQAWPAEDLFVRGSFLQTADLEAYNHTEDSGSMESRCCSLFTSPKLVNLPLVLCVQMCCQHMHESRCRLRCVECLLQGSAVAVRTVSGPLTA